MIDGVPSRFELPGYRASWRVGRRVRRVQVWECCIDQAWPWWRPRSVGAPHVRRYNNRTMTKTRPPRKVQRVNVDFPIDMLRTIDREVARLGITRQAFIKMRIAATLPPAGGGK